MILLAPIALASGVWSPQVSELLNFRGLIIPRRPILEETVFLHPQDTQCSIGVEPLSGHEEFFYEQIKTPVQRWSLPIYAPFVRVSKYTDRACYTPNTPQSGWRR
jgi:hypothetical protein